MGIKSIAELVALGSFAAQQTRNEHLRQYVNIQRLKSSRTGHTGWAKKWGLRFRVKNETTLISAKKLRRSEHYF